MDWKKLVLWSLPLWVVVALLFGVKPLSTLIHDEHLDHNPEYARVYAERATARKMAPRPPAEIGPPRATEEAGARVVEEPVMEAPAAAPPHELHAVDPNAAKHKVDQWLWILDYIIEYGNQMAGMLLALGQVFILLKLKEKKDT